MSRYRKIDTRIWIDDKFPFLSDDEKLLFFFAMTNPRMNMIGIAVQGKTDIAEFLGWTVKRLSKPFAVLLGKQMIQYDLPTRTLYVPNFWKYDAIENENQAKAAAKCVDEIPVTCPYLQDVKRLAEGLGKEFLKPLLERLAKGLPKPDSQLPTPNTQQVHGPEPTKAKTSAASLKAQAVEVLNYLNTESDKDYPANETNLGFIISRLKEGTTVEKCKQVIKMMVNRWKYDDKMKHYLRPATLFNRTKFNSYVGELQKPRQPTPVVKKDDPPPHNPELMKDMKDFVKKLS